jgi:derlin-1
MSSDIGDWYRGIPQISRYWFTGSVVLPLAGKIGLVTPISMIMNWYLLVHKFHLWRPVTALFYYPITPQTGFHYLMNLYFLYSYSTQLEGDLFQGRPAEYLFGLVFMWICSLVIAVIADVALLMDIMVMAVLYLWCSHNRDVIVRFWFGTQFKAMYLPWILFAFNLIIRGGGFDQLLGILVGHVYYFLMFKYPQDFGGRQLISTPGFFYKYFPTTRGGVHGFGGPPPAAAAGAGRRLDDNPGAGRGRHQWGAGNNLGQ